MTSTFFLLLFVAAFQLFAHANFAARVLAAPIPWDVWLPYLAGAVILGLGLWKAKSEIAHRHTVDKLMPFGPVFLAAPIAVFGAEHFTSSAAIARLMPSWIPGHIFWVLFVGACLFAAALGIALQKQTWLAATLFAVMILMFELLLHIPGVISAPNSRFAWAVALREFAFTGGALSLAAAQTEGWRVGIAEKITIVARYFIAIPITFFGVENFLHPEFASGVPLRQVTPAWLPGHLFWSYLTGVVFVIGGFCLLVNLHTRLAATGVGILFLLLVVAVYVPITIANPSDIRNGLNYVADTLMIGGCVLLLAETQCRELVMQAASA